MSITDSVAIPLNRGWPSVSVVVPLVDRIEMARRAVRSILSQEYGGAIECVVVLDGENDYEFEIPSEPTRSVRVIRNFRSKGLAGARNSGYLTASGDYVANCDDDDEWLPGKLDAQIRLAQARCDASVIATGVVFRFNGQEFARTPAATLVLSDFLADRHPEVHPSSCLFRRSTLVDEIGLVDETLPGGYAEDYELLIRATRIGPVASVTETLTVANWHDSSFFVSKWQMVDDALAALLERVPEFQSAPSGTSRILGQRAFASAAMGRRSEAVRHARRALRHAPRNRQSYAALAVASGLVSAERVLAMARRRGRGI